MILIEVIMRNFLLFCILTTVSLVSVPLIAQPEDSKAEEKESPRKKFEDSWQEQLDRVKKLYGNQTQIVTGKSFS